MDIEEYDQQQRNRFCEHLIAGQWGPAHELARDFAAKCPMGPRKITWTAWEAIAGMVLARLIDRDRTRAQEHGPIRRKPVP